MLLAPRLSHNQGMLKLRSQPPESVAESATASIPYYKQLSLYCREAHKQGKGKAIAALTPNTFAAFLSSAKSPRLVASVWTSRRRSHNWQAVVCATVLLLLREVAGLVWTISAVATLMHAGQHEAIVARRHRDASKGKGRRRVVVLRVIHASLRVGTSSIPSEPYCCARQPGCRGGHRRATETESKQGMPE